MDFHDNDNPLPETPDYAVAGEDRVGGGGGYRYRECLKNHAVSIGGNAVDGCCEFMAAGEEGTLDALLCAACNCHRNFHRKELEGGGGVSRYRPTPYHHHIVGSYRGAVSPTGYLHHVPPKQTSRLLALPSSVSRDDEEATNPSSSGGGGGTGGSRKRFRTKFSEEQKEKMLAFSESVGWRIQKQDMAAVEQFCGDAGVTRQVLKIWMHNNKQNLCKKPGFNSPQSHNES